ncbi:MAG: aspartate aminotransferase family protein [Chloroflexi bacterium]|nr:aspartate aminotransferase family protein [Chloroflexota bacterium]
MELQEFTDQEKEQLAADALEYILPHSARNADLARGGKIFTAGEGCYVYDIHGNRILDTFGSLLTSIIGHGNAEIKQAVMEQMDRLEFFPNYQDSFTVPMIKLAKKLAEIMPGDLEVTFFTGSGSEANEQAIKMARQYHWQNGQRHRYKVIARKCAYHGTTLATTSLTGYTKSRQLFEPLMPGSLFAPPARCDQCNQGVEHATCDLSSLRAIEEMVAWEDPESISAIIMDPLPGSNLGYVLPPLGYLQGVRDLCDKHGIVLIFDEVQTGFGKTGKWFACENWGVTPDIMTISKGLTSGYLPMGAAVASKKIVNTFRQGPGSEFRGICTYGGHTLSCAAALANIAIMQREKIVEQAAETGKYLEAELKKLYGHRIVGEVRGIGMVWAVELLADRESKAKLPADLNVGAFVRDWCWENGMILRNNADILVIAPALTMTLEEIDIMVGKINEVIEIVMKEFEL